MKAKNLYINSTFSTIAFSVLLTFGFVWTSFYKDAPFTSYMEGLCVALGIVTGKRLWQKWGGKKTGFRTDGQQEAKAPDLDDKLPLR